MNAYPELLSAVQCYEPDREAVYSVDVAAHLAGTSRHNVLIYCKHGFVVPRVDPEYGGIYFDEPTLRMLRHIEYLRAECGINLTGIQIILDLMGEVDRLREMVEG